VIAVPDGRSGDVLIFYGICAENEYQKVKSFRLHVGATVTALCISSNTIPYLYTCSAAGIQRWILSFPASESLLVDGCGLSPPDYVLNDALDGIPIGVDLNRTNDSLITCVDLHALVISLQTGRITARLEGHTAPVTAAAFRHDRERSAVTISEDRRFIVYDLASSSVLFQSAIFSPHPFVCLTMHTEPGGTCCAIGSSDGRVRVFDLATPGCRQVHAVDVSALTGDAPLNAHGPSPPTSTFDHDAPVNLN
jgi:WD40 repeat protein